jgi:hypothetical protein
MSNGGASSSPALNPRTSNAKSTRNQPKFQEGNKKFNEPSTFLLVIFTIFHLILIKRRKGFLLSRCIYLRSQGWLKKFGFLFFEKKFKRYFIFKCLKVEKETTRGSTDFSYFIHYNGWSKK